MDMITARGIKRCFTVGNGEPFYALKGIDLDIPEGKLAILKGRSGSGKTTLLNILSALDDATEGQVIIENNDLSEMSVADKEKLRRFDIGVAIARAVAHKPKVIFADEPTGALDTASGLNVMRLFKDLVAKEGITIVMTTHDPNLMELGDVVFEIEDGEIVGKA